MFTKGIQRISLVGLVAFALLWAGCAQSPQDQQAAGKDAQKSGAKLGGLFASTKPVAVPEGTVIAVTLDQAIASNQQKSGDTFDATVADAVMVGGVTAIPKGARARGRIVEIKESGRLKGVAEIQLALDSVEVDGKSYNVETSMITRTGGSHTKRNATMIGGGAGAGALIGGLAGGGKGALIGGAIGAGAGTAGAAATGKKDITLPAETQLSFKLVQPVTVQVKG